MHGGPNLRRHCLIDDSVLRQIESGYRLRSTAQSSGVVGHSIRAGALPATATGRLLRYGVSRWDAGCRAHPADPSGTAIGWHPALWISWPFLRSRSCANSGTIRPDRLIIAHLGNGASVTAVKDGQSIDTSMGLTPTGGVIMGTRCGDLDPGVLVYLVREKNFDATRLEALGQLRFRPSRDFGN